ncbi:MAG TPA: hypothetical protein VLA17_13995, partial [Candidatus Limnocylindria bacterium]|nr:hypothetical protein [Candidatus Limnocylindria bacterium]
MSHLQRSLASLVAALMFALPGFLAAAEKAKDDRVVKNGMMISLEYTLKVPDGKVIDSSKGGEPLRYIHG